MGLYSTDDSLDSELTEREAKEDSLSIDTSESVRFLFRENEGTPVDAPAGVVVLTGSPSASRMLYFGFLGPRLTPGRPRPSPLPETTEPSERVYSFTRRAEVLGSRFGGGI